MYQTSIMNNNKLRFALIFLGPYPKGNVSTIRIHSYCKSLAKKGHFVKVLLLAPCKEASVNSQRNGVYEGVHYQYLTDITWKNNDTSIFVKFFYYVLGLIKSLRYLKEDRISCLLSYHNNPLSNVFYWVVSRLLSIPFILDKTEYPHGYQKRSKVIEKIDRFFLRFYDGFIVISNELKEYYSQIRYKVFLLPMTIDIDRFKNVKNESVNKKYIAVVFGLHNRDGLKESIVSYKRYLDIIGEDITFQLKLIGDLENLPNKNEIISYIFENKLDDKIDVMGRVDIDRVPNLLVNASCLLTTPNSYISGGFPTKLGEYMLSKVPIVATSAGEISNYLTHKENILLSQPGDINNIALNLCYVHQNPYEADLLAQSSYQTVLKEFNADSYIDDLIVFIKSIK